MTPIRYAILSVCLSIALGVGVFTFMRSARGETRVIDGDSLVLSNGDRVRLAALDCPELRDPGGREAKAHLMALIRDRTLACVFSGRDRYRRLVGHCFAHQGPSYGFQDSLTCQMIRSGLCRRYPQYDRQGRYAGCQ